MAETGRIDFIGAAELAVACSKTLGQDISIGTRKTPVGGVTSVPFVKDKNVDFKVVREIPAGATLTTGLIFHLGLTDDGANAADLGKVGVFGVTVKRLVSDTDTTDVTVSGGAEVTANVTLSAASGVHETLAVAVPNASLDSAAVGDMILIRFRRVGDNTSDTCQGPILCTGVGIQSN